MVGRHWHVFLSSLIAVMSVLLLTPVTSALFDGDVLVQQQAFTTSRVDLYDAAAAGGNFSAGFVHISYAVAWLNSFLPRFATRDLALLPFQVPDSIEVSNETWTGEMILYEADLGCVPVRISPVDVQPFGTIGYELSNGTGPPNHYLRDLTRGIPWKNITIPGFTNPTNSLPNSVY